MELGRCTSGFRYMTGKHEHPKELQSGYWRQRAHEAREAIKDITNPANKKILEEVAQSYEEMADLIEGHGRLAKRLRPPAARASPPIDVPQACAFAAR